MSKETFVNKIIPHDSAYKHVSGLAEYTDDIKEPKETLYGAIGLSKKAHAIIKKMIDDESNHASKALQNGGVKLPHYIKTAMKFSSKLMKATSHWI